MSGDYVKVDKQWPQWGDYIAPVCEEAVTMSGWMENHDDKMRDAILEAAERLIYGKSLEFMTLGGVARESGISRSTLCQYFKSKESLCAALAARIVRSLNQTIESHVTGLRGFRKLRASCKAEASFRRDNPGKMKLLVELSALKISDLNDENVRELIRLVEANQHILTDSVREIAGGGTPLVGIDPLATGQFLHMVLQDTYGSSPARLALLDKHDICHGDFLTNCRDPVYRSILMSSNH